MKHLIIRINEKDLSTNKIGRSLSKEDHEIEDIQKSNKLSFRVIMRNTNYSGKQELLATVEMLKSSKTCGMTNIGLYRP